MLFERATELLAPLRIRMDLQEHELEIVLSGVNDFGIITHYDLHTS